VDGAHKKSTPRLHITARTKPGERPSVKTTNPKSDDTFDVFETYIICHSKSKEDYTITLNSCTCRGFNFHHDCRHFSEAREQGLLENLKNRKPTYNGVPIGSHAKFMRKDAIRQFLTKKNIAFTDKIIDDIEKVLDIRTRPEDVIKMATFV
jgi:hypothetical protein